MLFGVSASARRPRDADTEAGDQRLIDAKKRGQRVSSKNRSSRQKDQVQRPN